MAQELVLLSPEKTVITYRLAGIATRMLAHFVDMCIVSTTIFSLMIVLGLLGQVIGEGLAVAIMLIVASLGMFIYFIAFEAFWNGATLGKKAFKLRVRMADGLPVTFAAAMGRNFLRVADFLPLGYFVGTLAIFLNPRSQRLGDLVAGTVVIQERPDNIAFQPAPHQFGVHAYESHVGDLRGMTIEEYRALKQLCDRFPELSATVQQKLIREVWVPFAANRHIAAVPGLHPIYLAEAAVMRYGRSHGLL